jgi:aminopeptidase N
LIDKEAGTRICDGIPSSDAVLLLPNYHDYGYGIFLLDDKSRDYVLKNIQNEKDPFLRSMMWGALWDSVREAELDPREYVELAIKNLPTEKDETIVASILGRVGTARNYYMSEPPAPAGGQKVGQSQTNWPPAHAGGSDLARRFEDVLLDRMQKAPLLGQRITFYRAFLNNASSEKARAALKDILSGKLSIEGINCKGGRCSGIVAAPVQATPKSDPDQPYRFGGVSIPLYVLKTKDKFDIVTRLAILGDADAPKLLADLEKTETGDDARRYAYAAAAGFPTAENKAKFWNDFVNNKDISESWIEAAVGPFNSVRHANLTQQYLERALTELPSLKRTRKIFFINNWLAAWIGGQRDEQALAVVNKFLADNPNLDRDLRLKILENVDLIERAVKIRKKYS